MVVLLALVGVPLWVLVGGLAVALWSRSKVKKTPGIFRCTARMVSGSFPGIAEDWPRIPGYASWVHDVLLLHSGLTLGRTRPLPTMAVEHPAPAELDSDVAHLGDRPAVLAVRLDGGQVVALAAPSAEAARLAGPYSATVDLEG